MVSRLPKLLVVAALIAAAVVAILVRQALSATPPVVVAAAPLDCYNPAWSPSGQRIAFLREESSDTYVSLYEVATAETRDLARVCRECDYKLVWSPDGKRIAYWAQWNSGEPVIHVIDVNDGSIRKVVRGKDPTWSPDGRRLAFVAYPQLAGRRERVPAARDVIGGELGVIDRVTGAVRKLTAFPIARPLWSPRGDRIAFLHVAPRPEWTREWLRRHPEASRTTMESLVHGAAGAGDISTVWPNGKVLSRVTQGGMWGNVRWTAEGDRLLATRYASGTHGERTDGELWVLRPDGGQSRKLLDEPIALDEGFSVFFLPGGEEVVFEGKLPSAAGGHGRDLFYVEVAAAKPERLENEHAFKRGFTVSPDGNEIAYEIAADYGTVEIWKMSLDRREP